jgi:hypothetical protein
MSFPHFQKPAHWPPEMNIDAHNGQSTTNLAQRLFYSMSERSLKNLSILVKREGWLTYQYDL